MLSPFVAVLLATQSLTTVHVSDPAGGPAVGVAVSAECAGAQGPAVAGLTDVEGTITLSLPEGVCRLRSSGHGTTAWSVLATIPGDPIRLELLRAGRITGLLARDEPIHPPPTVAVRLTPALDPRSWLARTREDVLACPIADRRWTCTVPAAIDLDLELRVVAFAPHYLRRVSVAHGDVHDTGVQRVLRGASVAGWIVDGLGKAARAQGLVEAVARSSDRAQQPLKPVLSDRHGFFQIGALEAGVYLLRARAETGISLATPVRVEANKETKLPTPLAVRPVAKLSIFVDPPEDPEAKAWQLRLLGIRGPRAATIEADEAVGIDGRWSRHLPTGRYALTIHRADRSTWYRERFELGPGSREIDVFPGQARVSGSIRLGSEPLATDLVIGDRTTGMEVELKSDTDGAFEGWVPRLDVESARWWLRVREQASASKMFYEGLVPDLATADEVRFAIRIPSNAIEGTVTDEKRLPQEATVLAQSLGEEAGAGLQSTLPAQALSARESGDFAIRGLPPGRYAVFALVPTDEAGTAIQSEPVTVTVGHEGTRQKTALILRRTPGISGRVRTLGGAGVESATILATASNTPYAPAPLVRTDADGRFVTSVPKTAASVDLLVEAVGVGRRATRQPVGPGGSVDVLLDPELSGRLVVLADSRSDDRGTFVYHEHVLDAWNDLVRWGEWNGEVAGIGELRAPLMAPGMYRACAAAASIRAQVEAGAEKLPDWCTEGYLAPGGELRLIVPPPKK